MVATKTVCPISSFIQRLSLTRSWVLGHLMTFQHPLPLSEKNISEDENYYTRFCVSLPRCAPTAGPSSHAAPPVEAPWAPSGTWPWRRWPTLSSSPASTPHRAAKSPCLTPTRRSTKSCASFGHTPAPAPAPLASGRAPWTPSCLT